MFRFAALLWIAALGAPAQPAYAWESDQLTRRAEPLDDIQPAADATINAMLDAAAERATRRLGPRAKPRRVHRALARAVHHATARGTKVRGRGAFRGMGYGAFAAWMETGDHARRSFVDRSDVFGTLGGGRSFILGSLGTCSTFRLAGTLMGADKPDHFLDLGFRYFMRGGTVDPDKAVRYGTRTENTYYGWQTSSAFSQADLVANYAGYQFYAALLDPEGGYFRWTGERMERTRDFSWAEVVTPGWDELIAPTAYRPVVQRWLDAQPLPGACEGWNTWGPGVLRARAAFDHAPKPWRGPRARDADDPFRLTARCGAPTHTPSGVEPPTRDAN